MFKGKFEEGPLKPRCHKQYHCVPCLPQSLNPSCNICFTPARRLVSKKKVRFEEGGFNLDLAYITKRIITLGFPATGMEHFYRNPRNEVKRFLTTKHKGHYKVYNFCCEPGRGYESTELGPDVEVERYPFRDHGVPTVTAMSEFCNSAKKFLDEHPDNVVALHCKAGKGRAGIMTCCLLLRTGFKPSALEAMEYYEKMRVKSGKGLTVNSQRKFVCLYERLWREVWKVPVNANIGELACELNGVGTIYNIPVTVSRAMTSVEITLLPHIFNKVKKFKVIVMDGTDATNFDFSILDTTTDMVRRDDGVLISNVKCYVRDNFCVQVFALGYGILGNKKVKVLELWHNTMMVEGGNDTCYADFGLSEVNVKKALIGKVADLGLRLTFAGGVPGVLGGMQGVTRTGSRSSSTGARNQSVSSSSHEWSERLTALSLLSDKSEVLGGSVKDISSISINYGSSVNRVSSKSVSAAAPNNKTNMLSGSSKSNSMSKHHSSTGSLAPMIEHVQSNDGIGSVSVSRGGNVVVEMRESKERESKSDEEDVIEVDQITI